MKVGCWVAKLMRKQKPLAKTTTPTLGCPPFPVIVTTWIISCLVGDSKLNLHLPLLLGGGTTQIIELLIPFLLLIAFLCCFYSSHRVVVLRKPHSQHHPLQQPPQWFQQKFNKRNSESDISKMSEEFQQQFTFILLPSCNCSTNPWSFHLFTSPLPPWGWRILYERTKRRKIWIGCGPLTGCQSPPGIFRY